MPRPPIVNIASEELPHSCAFKFAICTLVTDWNEYGRMLDSFVEAGFTTQDCQYRFVDNTAENTFDAYGGINHFLANADAAYIIICHQDILLNYDKRAELETCIAAVDQLDNSWAVLGNAGTNNLYLTSMKITQGDKICYCSGVLPSRVRSLDENFLLVKRSANIALSADLSGFHLYGTDICLIAECLGYAAYAIEFNLLHLSKGKIDPSFYAASKQLQKKYALFFRGRYIKTTITRFYLTSGYLFRWFMNISAVQSLARLLYKFRYKIFNKY